MLLAIDVIHGCDSLHSSQGIPGYDLFYAVDVTKGAPILYASSLK